MPEIKSASTKPNLQGVFVNARLGERVEIQSHEILEVKRGPGDYGYTFKIKNGKSWKDASIGEPRLNKPDAGIYGGKIEGGVWFLEKDREKAIADLKACVRGALVAMRAEIGASCASLAESTPDEEETPEASMRP